MKLLVATRNAHKLNEIFSILSIPELELLSLNNFPHMTEVIEDGETFHENARLKAITSAKQTKMWTLADDSGIEVDALNGGPGVISARYAGEPSNDARNNAKLLAALGNANKRSARFRCVLALSDWRGECATVDGVCEGHIAMVAHGAQGFGYDSLFIPYGYTNTFGELEAGIKNRISHRYYALKCACDTWSAVFHGTSKSWNSISNYSCL